jgi:predicted porin
MKKLLFSALALLVAGMPFTNAAAENINIYGWQNYSWEFVSVDRNAGSDRDFDRIQGNAANIGFMSHMDTGMPGLQVGLRCEQFTFHNRLTSSGWCNRNSKISLRHETMGEIMFGQWLLPYNEIVAQWVDPFYDAGADSHTSIMGNIGFGGVFYNGGTFPLGGGSDFDYNGIFSLSFNRRQEEVIQYVWPNTSAMADQSRDGLQFRFAMTSGFNDESNVSAGDVTHELDPRIYSVGASWQHNMMNGDQLWVAVAYENHDDWTAFELGRGTSDGAYGLGIACDKSDDDAWRIAGRYTHDWGNGMNTMLAAMWEDMDYDTDRCSSEDGAVDVLWSDVERDAWMLSGKHNFGNGVAFKFSYMNADDLDCPEGWCYSNAVDGEPFSDGSTDAEAWNVGLTYTMPAGTELRLTYSDVDNSAGSNYDFGIGGAGNSVGEDLDMWAIGIVHWFD